MKLEKREEQVLPGRQVGREKRAREEDRGRNDPNNVFTCK
jgi:hypothetical protein